jgi:asparagine synthase (glutamine-hydrolysing)
MCGIFAIFGNQNSTSFLEQRDKFLQCSKMLRHRGPDWNGIYLNEDKKAVVCHERLSIIDVEHGAQPLQGRVDGNESIYGDYQLSVNGEIYNHRQIRKTVIQDRYLFETNSDCEVIIPLYREFRESFLNILDGVFAFFLYDSGNHDFLVARDPIGVNPLYYAVNSIGEWCFASELKAIRAWDSECVIKNFPPGHYMNKALVPVRYYYPRWHNFTQLHYEYDLAEDIILQRIRDTLIESVEKRMMADVPFGTLLSGGLDSSLVTSIASRLFKKNTSSRWHQKLHTFSIGLVGSPDLKYAREVANFLGTVHHEINFTVQEGIDAIRDVIYHLETYDVTTIRASTPMYLMSRKIKATGIKMVLSGEGADEILGGYLYFHNAPSENEFHRECIDRVKNLHSFDCLRANKSTMSWGLEVRVPFLDKQFLETAVPIRQNLKLNKIEKYCLRKAFDTPDNPFLPESVLWRQKEQFGDGVGYNWIDSLISMTQDMFTPEDLKVAQDKYTTNPPQTKEALYFRNVFEELFPNCENTVEYWIPNTKWQGVKADPSGRAQAVHLETGMTNNE